MNKTAKMKDKNFYDLSQQLNSYNEELLAMNEELDQSLEELNLMNKKFISVINIVSDLNNENELKEKEFLSYLLKNAVNVVSEADYGKIYLIENGYCKFIEAVGHDLKKLNNLKPANSQLYYSSSNRVFNSKDHHFNSNKISEDLNNQFKKALKPIKESINANIVVNDIIIGRISLDIAEDSIKEFKDTTKIVMDSFAAIASSFFAFKDFNKLQNKFTKELISSIIAMLELYDNYTSGHSENVANLAAKIAKKMKLSKNLVTSAYWSGMVHDIGKILIPIDILNKKDSLTKKEFKLIKKHPVWGSEALSRSDSLRHISKYVLYHHERWDGRGYPEGKTKDEIPLISQIIAVADSWDAMRSQRAYRDTLTQNQALAELKKNKGKQFAPEVVDTFLEIFSF